MSVLTATDHVLPFANEYGQVLTLNPALLTTVSHIAGISIKCFDSPAAEQVLADLIQATHHGALTNASSYLEADVRSQQWKTIRTWLNAGSKVFYYYGEQLDLLLVDHGHGQGGQAYKGYSILSA